MNLATVLSGTRSERGNEKSGRKLGGKIRSRRELTDARLE
jgi:hypothetical protein